MVIQRRGLNLPTFQNKEERVGALLAKMKKLLEVKPQAMAEGNLWL